MKQINLLAVFIVVVVFLCSCKDYRYNDGFSSKLFEYWPYQTGDSVTYVNEEGDSITFVLQFIAENYDPTIGWEDNAEKGDFNEGVFQLLYFVYGVSMHHNYLGKQFGFQHYMSYTPGNITSGNMNFSVYKKRDVDTSKDPFSPEAFVFPEEDVSLTYDKFFSDTVYLTGRDYPVDTFFITTEVVRGKGITWWIDLDHHCWKLVER